ncbi:MAG: cation transporter [Oligoflexia bacterium]|nr:cation transporter [Oligoflexia bacterium]
METVAKTKQVTWVSFFVNLFCVSIKFTGGYFGHSQAVIADAVHSLSDSVTDIAILIGVHYWHKPPDNTHPYGHRKIETIVTIFIGISLFLVAAGLCYNAILSIKQKHDASPSVLALASIFVSIVFKEWLYRWSYKLGTLLKSSALTANALHHRSDVFSSIPAFIAVLCSILLPDFYFLDHIGAIAVSLVIFQSAFEVLKPAWFELVDASASSEKIELIQKLALDVKGVMAVHALRTRHAGSELYIDLHVQVNPDISVAEGYNIARDIKKSIYENMAESVNIVVQIEPFNAYKKS